MCVNFLKKGWMEGTCTLYLPHNHTRYHIHCIHAPCLVVIAIKVLDLDVNELGQRYRRWANNI